MKPMVLKLIRPIPPGIRLNLQGVTPAELKELSIREILNCSIAANDRTNTLGDWFTVTDGERMTLRIEGDVSRADYLGHRNQGGTIEVMGSVGHHLAEGMTDGKITVHGDSGDCAGGGLRGGTVVIRGNTGDYTAGALPGQKHGMRGGQLVVAGNVGSWAAARMRRGLLIVQGQIGGGLAMRMIAGTVIACGAVQRPFGCGMRRGTILLYDQPPPDAGSLATTLPGFTRPEQAELLFLPLLLKQIRDNLPGRLQEQLPKSYAEYPRTGWRSLGDLCAEGLGEVIWLSIR